jgi:hypothetical protein
VQAITTKVPTRDSARTLIRRRAMPCDYGLRKRQRSARNAPKRSSSRRSSAGTVNTAAMLMRSEVRLPHCNEIKHRTPSTGKVGQEVSHSTGPGRAPRAATLRLAGFIVRRVDKGEAKGAHRDASARE